MRKVLGFTDEVTTCELCGKNPLKGTFAFEDEDGQIKHYGSECINKQFGVDDKKLKSICQKVEVQKDQEFLRGVDQLESKKLLNAILSNNSLRKRYDDARIETFIEKFLSDRLKLFNEFVQPYPHLRDKYKKGTLDDRESILKKIKNADNMFDVRKGNPTSQNSSNTVF
jgi:hypothetical protein